MRQRKVLLTLSAIFILTFLLGVGASWAGDRKLELLGDSISTFNEGLINGQYGKIWDLRTDKLKELKWREDFITAAEFNFKETTIITRWSFAYLIRENVAVSKSSFVILRNSGEREQCEGILWVWSEVRASWNYVMIFPCSEESTITSDAMLPILLKGELD